MTDVCEPEEQREIVHEPMMRLITFNLDSECYGVEVSRVREILRSNQIFPVPGAVECVAGITNIRGNVVTILDGRKRMNLPETEFSDSSRMIVMESSEEMAAVIVDSVSDVIDVPKSAIVAGPHVSAREDSPFVEGVVSNQHSLIIILNVDRLIADDTLDMAAGF